MRILLLASYCDENGCTEDLPCEDCLVMCNTAEIGDTTVIKDIKNYSYERDKLKTGG